MRRKLKITALFITIIALPLLSGCDDLYKNYIRNDTDESISVAYVTFSSDEVKTCMLGPGEVFDKPTRDNGEFFKDAWVYDGKEPEIRDNAFHVDASSVFVITKEEKVTYTLDVAIPSVTINLLKRSGKLKYDYYGAPWEAEADLLGGVKRLNNNRLWPEGAYNSYYDLIKMFWE